jgi:uncharacterized protein YdhG (YjbR/CyaY superfamily)
MDNTKTGFASMDAYIATFPEDIQRLLQSLRATIQAAAPDAVEKISYQMPTFALKGNLVHFAAWKNHIGFYPGSAGVVETFRDELSAYEQTKGSIHFPFSQPLPLNLITRIAQFRVAENLSLAESKAARKKPRG